MVGRCVLVCAVWDRLNLGRVQVCIFSGDISEMTGTVLDCNARKGNWDVVGYVFFSTVFVQHTSTSYYLHF